MKGFTENTGKKGNRCHTRYNSLGPGRTLISVP